MKTTTSTSEKILDIAQELIVAGGYNGFSYSDISASIGIRKASIHHHFPTKADLVAALVDRYRRAAENGLNAIEERFPDPVERLRFYLDYWQACIRNAAPTFCVCAMLAGEIQMLPQDVASGVRAHFRNLAAWLTALLKAGAEQGLIRLERPAEAEAQMLMASVHGAMLSARAFGDTELFATIVNVQAGKLLAPDR